MDEVQDKANADIAAAIRERVAAVELGAELAAEGVTTVGLDDDGHLVEHRPDGTTSRLRGTQGAS